MNIFTILESDHQKIKTMFSKFHGLEDEKKEGKQKLADEIFSELEIHTQIEEEFFYPAILKSLADDEKGKRLLEAAYTDHRLVKERIEELRALEAEDEVFLVKFSVLRENVENHMEEEEGELFPEAKKLLEGKIENISRLVQERKEELML